MSIPRISCIDCSISASNCCLYKPGTFTISHPAGGSYSLFSICNNTPGSVNILLGMVPLPTCTINFSPAVNSADCFTSNRIGCKYKNPGSVIHFFTYSLVTESVDLADDITFAKINGLDAKRPWIRPSIEFKSSIPSCTPSSFTSSAPVITMS